MSGSCTIFFFFAQIHIGTGNTLIASLPSNPLYVDYRTTCRYVPQPLLFAPLQPLLDRSWRSRTPCQFCLFSFVAPGQRSFTRSLGSWLNRLPINTADVVFKHRLSAGLRNINDATTTLGCQNIAPNGLQFGWPAYLTVPYCMYPTVSPGSPEHYFFFFFLILLECTSIVVHMTTVP